MVSNEAKKPRKKRNIGNYFGVDRASVESACKLGMNPAVAYLVLASFTDETNRFTAASVKAIETYTSIGRKRAEEAIEALIAGKLIQRVPREQNRPYYELLGAPPAPPPPSAKAFGYRHEPLTPVETKAFEMVSRGETPRGKWNAAAERAKRRGWLDRETWDGPFLVRPPPPPPPPAKPEMVWLPNELVTGVTNEPSPVERVRKTSDPLVLQLLVELYSEQSLTDDGGIDRRVLWQPFTSKHLGTVTFAPFNVWEFEVGKYKHCSPAIAKAYATENPKRNAWDRIGLLEQVGLIQWRLQLFDAPDGALIHPLGPRYDNELINIHDAVAQENVIGRETLLAALHLLLTIEGQHRPQQEYFNRWGELVVAPIAKEVLQPTVIAVARLRYRPKVSDTAKWYGQLVALREVWEKAYADISQRAKERIKKAANS